MKIKPTKSSITEFHLVRTDEVEAIELDFDARFYEDEPRKYSIVFKLLFIHIEGIKVECEFLMEFETESEINEDFISSPFVKINSPAIAYPFLRSSLATIFLNCGYSPAMLPSVNFTTFKKGS